MEISVPGDIASDKPSTSPNVQSPTLNTDSSCDPINLVTPQVVSTGVTEKAQPPKTQQWRLPLRSLHRIGDILNRKMGRIVMKSRIGYLTDQSSA